MTGEERALLESTKTVVQELQARVATLEQELAAIRAAPAPAYVPYAVPVPQPQPYDPYRWSPVWCGSAAVVTQQG